MSSEDHVVSFSLEVNVEKAYEDIRRVQALLYRMLALIRRMGLPEDVEKAITRIQRLIAILNTLRLTLLALEAASGPIGWALFGVGMLGTIVSVGDLAEEVHSH
jgi:hypothetical protein